MGGHSCRSAGRSSTDQSRVTAGPYHLAALTGLPASAESVESELRRLTPAAPRRNRRRVQRSTARRQPRRSRTARSSYFLESQNPTLTPGTVAARTAGDRYGLTSTSTPGVTLSTRSTTNRTLFADMQMRRAVQYALDRRTLAEWRAARTRDAPPVVGRRGVHAEADVPGSLRPPNSSQPCIRCRRTSSRVHLERSSDRRGVQHGARRATRAIGLRMSVIPIDQSKGFEAAKAARSDLVWGGLSANTADPAAYLRDLILPPSGATELRRVQALFSPERERAGAALAPGDWIGRRCSLCTCATRSRSCARSGSGCVYPPARVRGRRPCRALSARPRLIHAANRRYAPWQRLYFLPLPHQHGSLRPMS